MLKDLIILFSLTTMSNAISTLRSVFVAKKQTKPAYIATFVDAIIFATVMKRISNGEDFIFIIVYAIGRVLGVCLGNYMENKIALGILEVELLVNDKDAMKKIADELRELGYSTETIASYGYKGRRRYTIKVTTLRKELEVIKNVANKHGYETPTMKIKEVSKVLGKYSLTSE